jgi:general stress protein YciG
MAQQGDSHETRPSQRGFARMDPARQREIARKGGANVPHEKRSFAQNRALASEAGRKGGRRVAAHARSFSQDRALASEAGRKGGRMSRRRRSEPGDGNGGSNPLS